MKNFALFLTLVSSGALLAQQGPSPQLRDFAGRMLDSPRIEYCSQATVHALEYLSGRTAAAAASAAARSSGRRPRDVASYHSPRFQVLVNDPATDPDATLDVTTQSETAVAGFGNTVVVAYNDSAQALRPPISRMGYSRSTDGGRTFRDMGAIPVTPTLLNFGDPALVVNRRGQYFAAALVTDLSRPAQFASTIGLWRSLDDGVTFGVPALVPQTGQAEFTANDKELLAVDNTGGPRDGSLYLAWTGIEVSFPPTVPILFSRSTDNGASLSAAIRLTLPGTVNQGADVVVGPRGEVYVTWLQTAPTAAIMTARSLDGGATFGAPVIVAPVIPPGFGGGIPVLGGNARTNGFPRIDANPRNGEIYIVYPAKPTLREDTSDIFFTRSSDGGATWATPIRVNDDNTANDQFFPDVAVNAEGEIQAIWYDRRHDNENYRIAVFGARSRNGGRSFESNHRVTPDDVLPSVGYDPTAGRTYMGDYLDIRAITGPAGVGEDFLLAWGDFRRLVSTAGGVRPDQDVFFTRK